MRSAGPWLGERGPVPGGQPPPAKVGDRVEPCAFLITHPRRNRHDGRSEHLTEPVVDHARRSAPLADRKHASLAKQDEDWHAGAAHVDAAWPQELCPVDPFLGFRQRCDLDVETRSGPTDLTKARRQQLT